MAAWYADSSAVVKLVRHEAESAALRRWLRSRQWVGSDLHRTELRRVMHRIGPVAVQRAERVLAQADLLELPSHVYDRAGVLDPPSLRSLDALHLAVALTLGADLAGIVAYDQRLLAAATDVGIPVASPA